MRLHVKRNFPRKDISVRESTNLMKLVVKTGVLPFKTYKNRTLMSVSSNLRESAHGDNIIPADILNEEQN